MGPYAYINNKLVRGDKHLIYLSKNIRLFF